MSAQEQQVLFCGFRTIENLEKYFKSKSLARGNKLYRGQHVFGVKEVIYSDTAPSHVIGRCAAQTKPAEYDVWLELSAEPRRIIQASCSCKAGCCGWCKHAAAVAVYIHQHKHESCTDKPCAWGMPSACPTLDTKISVKDLFIARPLPAPLLEPLCPATVLRKFPDVKCVLTHILQCESGTSSEQSECSGVLRDLVDEVVDAEDTALLRSILCEEGNTYSTMEVTSAAPLRVKRKEILSALTEAERDFYQKFVIKNADEIVETSLATRGQAVAQRWHEERRVRITSSTAHRVISRRSRFEELAKAFKTPRSFTTNATSYGREAEAAARRTLAQALGTPVHEVGLVIHPEQPWLCCSPDGVVKAGSTTHLVEIKCPYNTKDGMLIDHNKELSFIKYICYDNGHLVLKKRHPYYTQIMVMLYILNMDSPFFYVYTSQQQVTVIVKRDESFLAEFIPKLEQFYFTYYLKELAN